jgi:hypothetical protein
MNTKESSSNSTCAEQIQVAERELSAFLRAVAELFGPEQARLAAGDWLDASESMDTPPRRTSRDWRAVTVAASDRLVNRLTAVNHRTSVGTSVRPPLAASPEMKISDIPSSNCFESALSM